MATLQLSTAARNARLTALAQEIGNIFVMELRSGALPSNCAAVSTGSLLARDTIPADSPSDAWADAASGAMAKNGTWTLTGIAGIATTNIGYFRIYKQSSPDECVLQGDVTATGGGGAMTVDNVSLAAAQVVTVTGFTLTDGNA